MFRLNHPKLKKFLFAVAIGVTISFITAGGYFLINSINKIYKIEDEHKKDKTEITNELNENRKLSKELRIDFIDNQRENSKMFTEFKEINEENSKDHKEIITEMNKIKFVIIKNNKSIEQDLQDLKNFGNLTEN